MAPVFLLCAEQEVISCSRKWVSDFRKEEVTESTGRSCLHFVIWGIQVWSETLFVKLLRTETTIRRAESTLSPETRSMTNTTKSSQQYRKDTLHFVHHGCLNKVSLPSADENGRHVSVCVCDLQATVPLSVWAVRSLSHREFCCCLLPSGCLQVWWTLSWSQTSCLTLCCLTFFKLSASSEAPHVLCN